MATRKGYLARILTSLAEIHEDKNATSEERIQALRLSLEAIRIRPVPNRPTAKDRAITEALGGKKNPKRVAHGKELAQKNKDRARAALEGIPESGKD